MTKKIILRSQANSVFELIKNFGMDPAEFKWSERRTKATSEGVVSILIHYPSQYYFLFDLGSAGNHWAEYSPGETTSVVSLHHTDHWSAQLSEVARWLRALKREVESPDLWATISRERELVDAANQSGSTNTKFNPEEQSKVLVGLTEIKDYLVKTASVSQDKLLRIEKQYEYLKESSQRLGRKDFLNILLAILIEQILACGIVPDKARELLRFAAQVFSWLTNATGALPLH